MAVAVDSSVLVRYFTRDDEKLYDDASKLFKEAGPNSILLDRIILAESGYVLRSVYELSKKQIVSIYKALLSNNIFSVTDRELVEVTVDVFNQEQPLSFEDSWLLALKNNDKVSGILTFDKDLIKKSAVDIN